MGDASNLEPTEQAAPCTCGASADEICTCIAEQTAELIAAADANAAAIIAAINEQTDTDVEYVCGDAGNWELVTFIDGVETSRVDTGVSCDDPPPQDIEPVEECRNGTIHNVWYAVDPANPGTQIELAAADTALPCEQPTPECVKWQSVVVQIDNTGTLFSEATTITIESTDGSIDSFVSGPHAGWSDQVTDIAAQMDALFSGSYDPRCAILPNGCGGLLPPPSDAPAQPGIAARYINGVHCPTDIKIPVKATATRASGKEVTLPFYVITGPEYRGQICRSCNGGAGALQFEDGTPVPEADLPVCTFSCAETIPEAPLSVCQSVPLAGNWCDVIASTDPEVPDETVESEIIVTITTCGSEQSISFSIIDDDGGLLPYEPQGSIVDCETGEAPFVEPPPCPEGAVFEQVCVPANSYGILDNSLWDNAPTPHLQAGKAYEFTFTHADGSTTTLPALADPYFNSFIATLPTVMPGCKVIPVCANHTAAAGCRPAHVANLAMYPAYDAPTAPGDPQNGLTNPALEELWATGWLIDCAGCESPIVSVEITGSSDAAWVGVGKAITTYQGEETVAFRSVNCDGEFWKDCDGNDIAEPVGGCCAKPCGPDASDALTPVDVCFESTCEAIGLEGRYTTAPDVASDLTAVSISGDYDDGSEVIWVDEPVTNLTWSDYLDGGRLGDLIAGLNIGPFEYEYEWLNRDGENAEVLIKWYVCPTDELIVGLSIRFKSGDATINGETKTITVAGSGTGLLNTATKSIDCVLDALGNEVEGAVLVECPDAVAEPDCTHTECIDPCINGSTYIFGRPPAGQPWAWGPYSGDNLVEFEAALTAAGYTVNQIGEKHQICPPFGEFGEDPDALVINSVGESVATVEPNIDPDFVPNNECAVRTVGCNDDRRDDKLDTIINLLDSVIGDCPVCDGASGSGSVVAEYALAEADATEQSYGIGDVNAGNPGNGIKFDTANALSADLTAAHAAIRDCIAAGNVANVVITDQDGATVELNLDFDNTTEDAAGNVQQYSYEGADLPDIDPGSGKIRAMVVSCAGESDAQCIRTGASCKTEAVNTHLIEGCIEVDSPEGSDTVAAFTIVDDDGVPLFPPKPLTDLGFVDCCPVVDNTRPAEVVNEGGAVRG